MTVDWADPPEGLLDTLWKAGDPTADERVAAFIEDHRHVEPKHLFRLAHRHMADAPDCADQHLRSFFAEVGELPEWADEDLLRAGETFFRRRILPLNLAFLLGSLPFSYLAGDGATVLARTGEFSDNTRRRVFETARLIHELSMIGEMRPGGRSFLMAQRLRFLHGIVRATVHRSAWDVEEHGEPVSQLDLLGTLWSFSLTSIDVARRHGTCVPDDDMRAWLHLWNVFGHVLGIGSAGPEGLIPQAEPAARQAFRTVAAAQFRTTDEGKALAEHLRLAVHDLVPLRIDNPLVDAALRYNLGPELANALGLPQRRVPRVVRWGAGWWRKTDRGRDWVNEVFADLNVAVLEALIEHILDKEEEGVLAAQLKQDVERQERQALPRSPVRGRLAGRGRGG
jgi:hypothetical protein